MFKHIWQAKTAAYQRNIKESFIEFIALDDQSISGIENVVMQAVSIILDCSVSKHILNNLVLQISV